MQFPAHVFTLSKILLIAVMALISWGVVYIVGRAILQALGVTT